MVRDIQKDFNTVTNILVLFLLVFGGFVWADTNGVWNRAEDVRSGIFGDDEGGGNFTFINNVTIVNDLNVNTVNGGYPIIRNSVGSALIQDQSVNYANVANLANTANSAAVADRLYSTLSNNDAIGLTVTDLTIRGSIIFPEGVVTSAAGGGVGSISLPSCVTGEVVIQTSTGWGCADYSNYDSSQYTCIVSFYDGVNWKSSIWNLGSGWQNDPASIVRWKRACWHWLDNYENQFGLPNAYVQFLKLTNDAQCSIVSEKLIDIVGSWSSPQSSAITSGTYC